MHLRPQNRFSLTAYTTYYTDHAVPANSPTAGKTAILIYSQISHQTLPNPQTTQIKTTAVTISIADTEICLAFVYSKLHIVPTTQELDTLLNHILSTIPIIAMSCKHPSWKSRTTSAAVMFYSNLPWPDPMSSSSAQTVRHTYPTNRTAAQMFSKLLLSRAWSVPYWLMISPSSDHNPLVMTFWHQCNSTGLLRETSGTLTTMSYPTTFHQSPVHNKWALECQALHLQDTITFCMDKCTYNVPAHHRKYQLLSDVMEAIHQWQHLAGCNWYNLCYPTAKQLYRRQSDYVKQLLVDVN